MAGMEDVNNIFDRFASDEEHVEDLKMSFDLFLHERCGLHALKIVRCNAVDGFGVPFSEAYCLTEKETESYHLVHSFGSLFWPGYEMLQAYINDPDSPPGDETMKTLMAILLNYLLEHKESKKALLVEEKDPTCKITKTDWTVRLAEHYFSKLSLSSLYRMDKYSRNKDDRCLCGCGADLSQHYGDTGIGNGSAWHGYVDMLLGTCDLPVHVVEEQVLPDGSIIMEDEFLECLQDPTIAYQTIAQTIVYSFIQKKQHPEYKLSLIPSICVSKNSIMFYFYDSEHDILLESPTFPLYSDERLSTYTILATWFVVNYKHLCSGITDEIQKDIKADFFRHAGEQLDVYKDYLTSGSGSLSVKRKIPFEPWMKPCKLKFGQPLHR